MSDDAALHLAKTHRGRGRGCGRCCGRGCVRSRGRRLLCNDDCSASSVRYNELKRHFVDSQLSTFFTTPKSNKRSAKFIYPPPTTTTANKKINNPFKLSGVFFIKTTFLSLSLLLLAPCPNRKKTTLPSVVRSTGRPLTMVPRH